jgi:hypothetical protein
MENCRQKTSKASSSTSDIVDKMGQMISVHMLCLDDCFATTTIPQRSTETQITQFHFRPASYAHAGCSSIRTLATKCCYNTCVMCSWTVVRSLPLTFTREFLGVWRGGALTGGWFLASHCHKILTMNYDEIGIEPGPFSEKSRSLMRM